MRLRKEVLKKINTVQTRIDLAKALGCTEQWVIRLLDANKKDGPLTTYSALKVIKEATGLTDEQVLEDTPTLANKAG